MLHKNIKKIISILSAVIIAFSCFCFSASAVDVSVSFDGLELTDILLTLRDADGNTVEGVGFTYFQSSESSILENEVSIGVYNANGFKAGIYTLMLQFTADDYLVNNENYCIGGYSLYVQSSAAKFKEVSNFPYCFRLGGSEPIDFADFELSQYQYLDRCRVNFGKNELGTSYSTYINHFSFELLKDTTSIGFYLDDFDLRLVSPADLAAGEITGSIEENTDEILNGWDGSDKTPDSSSFDELEGLEDGIDNSTGKLLTGYDSAGNPVYSEGTLLDLTNRGVSNIFDGFVNYFQSQKSLMAVTRFLSDIFYIPEFSTFLTFSLALGVIPLIVGLGINTVRGFDRRDAARARAEAKSKSEARLLSAIYSNRRRF